MAKADLQETADRLGEVIVQEHRSGLRRATVDVYWPSGQQYTNITKEALRGLCVSAFGDDLSWHEGEL